MKKTKAKPQVDGKKVVTDVVNPEEYSTETNLIYGKGYTEKGD